MPTAPIDNFLAALRGDDGFMANVAAWRTLPAQPARFAPMPAGLHPALIAALRARGVGQLYTHQAQSAALALAGKNIAVVTPTASGKTLCYNLPVLHGLLSAPNARALYLFPTKALAQDQLTELQRFEKEIEKLEIGNRREPRPPTPNLQSSILNFSIATYDGDTPTPRRPRIRKESRLILTNPDMLHAGILPYHTGWADFLGGLRYVVIDEMHAYRGVFGSHVANVLRRLQRVCALYGGRPRFICTSATIANPGELARALVEQPVTVIDDSGAPRGGKEIILYNPPMYDAEQGLRRSSVLETQDLAARAVLAGVQTIVFGRSRLTTEILLTYLREKIAKIEDSRLKIGNSNLGASIPDSGVDGKTPATQSSIFNLQSSIRGYRGGYLPHERRAIEAGLREGQVRTVVTTNALELGIDIGQLQAAILCGYPGSIASAWQQMGRAGRTEERSLAILVASAGMLDQYVIQHPEFLFEQSPEHALINPNNLMLLVDHLRCAAFELPFREDESFGESPFTADVLALLAEAGELHQAGGRFFWSGEGYPAREVSLRSASRDSVVIQELDRQGRPRVIGEIDHASAPVLVHDGAIYWHGGDSYQVERLDLNGNLARVRRTAVDYYTEARTETAIDILDVHEQRATEQVRVAHGELLVSAQVIGYRRVKRFTHETVGVRLLDYPPQTLETSGYWFGVRPAVQRLLAQAGQWHDSANDYGPNWQEQRRKVRARDGYRCTQCGAPEQPGRQHDVHHLIPFRVFGYMPGINEAYREANRLDNLVLVCRNCHRRLESGVRVRTGLDGLAYALSNLAPLHLMCDRADLGVSVERGGAPGKTGDKAGDNDRKDADSEDNLTIDAKIEAIDETEAAGENLPTLTIFERIAAGLGFSARLYELHDQLLQATQERIDRCPCPHGCPACVGPVSDAGQVRLDTKQLTTALLRALAV
jgi:DEAD/DEAH box helicase domain-containing protein